MVYYSVSIQRLTKYFLITAHRATCLWLFTETGDSCSCRNAVFSPCTIAVILQLWISPPMHILYIISAVGTTMMVICSNESIFLRNFSSVVVVELYQDCTCDALTLTCHCVWLWNVDCANIFSKSCLESVKPAGRFAWVEEIPDLANEGTQSLATDKVWKKYASTTMTFVGPLMKSVHCWERLQKHEEIQDCFHTHQDWLSHKDHTKSICHPERVEKGSCYH